MVYSNCIELLPLFRIRLMGCDTSNGLELRVVTSPLARLCDNPFVLEQLAVSPWRRKYSSELCSPWACVKWTRQSVLCIQFMHAFIHSFVQDVQNPPLSTLHLASITQHQSQRASSRPPLPASPTPPHPQNQRANYPHKTPSRRLWASGHKSPPY